MAATISITVDTKRLELALHELAKYARVAPGQVMKQEGSFLARALVKLTPPATFAQGRKAVAGDINRVFTTVPTLIKNADKMGRISDAKGYKRALVRAFKQGDEAQMQNLLTMPTGAHVVQVKPYRRDGKNVAGYQSRRPGRPAFPEIAGGTKMGGPLNPSLHRNRRNQRGRVTGGNIASQVVNPKDFRDYVKKIQGRVGWHASGWGALAISTGAKLPAWISKQRLIPMSGSATVNWGANPMIRAVNRDIKIPGYQRTVDAVVANRVRVTAKKIDALIAGRAVNLGFTRIDARR